MFTISPRQAYSFVVDFLNNSVQFFLLSSFHSTLSILSGGFCVMSSSSIIPSSQARVLFLSFLAGVLPKFFYSFLFVSCSNRSGFRVYLVSLSFWFSSYSSFLFSIECPRFLASSLEFLFHLTLFLFRLGSKISGRDLLLVEECCNAPDSMRQVSASYSPSLPCHFLACCILPCHHVHRICIRVRLMHPSFSQLSVLYSDTPTSSGAPFCLFSCVGVKHSRIGLRFSKRPWYTNGRPPVKFRAIWTSFDTPTVNRGTE